MDDGGQGCLLQGLNFNLGLERAFVRERSVLNLIGFEPSGSLSRKQGRVEWFASRWPHSTPIRKSC